MNKTVASELCDKFRDSIASAKEVTTYFRSFDGAIAKDKNGMYAPEEEADNIIYLNVGSGEQFSIYFVWDLSPDEETGKASPKKLGLLFSSFEECTREELERHKQEFNLLIQEKAGLEKGTKDYSDKSRQIVVKRIFQSKYDNTISYRNSWQANGGIEVLRRNTYELTKDVWTVPYEWVGISPEEDLSEFYEMLKQISDSFNREICVMGYIRISGEAPFSDTI